MMLDRWLGQLYNESCRLSSDIFKYISASTNITFENNGNLSMIDNLMIHKNNSSILFIICYWFLLSMTNKNRLSVVVLQHLIFLISSTNSYRQKPVWHNMSNCSWEFTFVKRFFICIIINVNLFNYFLKRRRHKLLETISV